ncbi:MAG: hypothetical protein LC789_06950 [Actinobacteria bacterium]|nr:hypothetical protein [Actinomycetota bacterium]
MLPATPRSAATASSSTTSRFSRLAPSEDAAAGFGAVADGDGSGLSATGDRSVVGRAAGEPTGLGEGTDVGAGITVKAGVGEGLVRRRRVGDGEGAAGSGDGSADGGGGLR